MSLFENASNANEFNNVPEADQRNAMVFMAQAAESAERYEDMSRFMRKLVKWTDQGTPKKNLTVEERNLLSVAYKNVIGSRRASWRTLTSYAQDNEGKFDDLINASLAVVETELVAICKDILGLLSDILIPNATPPADTTPDTEAQEAQVFFLKMAGDYYRYLAECVTDEGHDKQASNYYGQAYGVAKEALATTHPVRLGLALNYSVCHYEILKDKNEACSLAKSAFDGAIQELDKLPEEQYKDSTLIMQLLRDNLTLWTSGDQLDPEES